MALYAIGDLHLSLTADKPMEVFGPAWENYVSRIEDGLAAALAGVRLPRVQPGGAGPVPAAAVGAAEAAAPQNRRPQQGEKGQGRDPAGRVQQPREALPRQPQRPGRDFQNPKDQKQTPEEPRVSSL